MNSFSSKVHEKVCYVIWNDTQSWWTANSLYRLLLPEIILVQQPREIKLIWQSHLHLNYELKTTNLLHCNCLWSFRATSQSFLISGQNDAVLYLILLFIVHLQDKCNNRIRESDLKGGLTEEPPNRRMIGWSRWLWT